MKAFELNDINGYKALILDLDGTLLDSMGVWNEVDEIFLNKRGFEVTPDYTDVVKKSNMRQSAEYTVKRFGLKETPEEVIAEWESTVEYEYAHTIKLKEGAKTFLEHAKASGLRISCATALNRKNAVAALTNNGVYQFFDKMVTLDDIDFEVNKSDPHIFVETANALGVKISECLVFEDVLSAVKGAKSGGFRTVAVYDDLGKREYSEACETADYHIDDWRQI